MNTRTISTVSEYIDIINDLTSNQDDIARQQKELLQFLSSNDNIKNSLREYYQIILEQKSVNLEKINYNKVVLGEFNLNEEKEKYNYQFYYRGHYKSSFSLLPSAFRGNNWNNEDFYYHEIMVQCPQHFQYSSHLDKLVTMQHYDCPTRLLDVTSNPLVALYFACKNYGCKKCDASTEGEVIVFPVLHQDVVYSDSDRALLLSCIAKFGQRDKEKLLTATNSYLSIGKFKQISGGSRYSDDIVERFFHEITTELPSFKRELRPIDLLQPLFVQPNKTNGRILKQDGAFIINGLSENSNEATEKLKNLSHISIKIHNQNAILKELAFLGIHEASLFPEVDKVAQYLKDNV